MQLVAHLLDEQRLFVSAQLHATKTMFTNLRKGSTEAEFIKADQHRHPFDSLSYPIIAEAPMDMLKSQNLTTAKKDVSPRIVVASI